MGNLHLVTGHAGKAHVTAADHASLNAAIFGEGEFVLNRGSQFAATVISNNSIRVADGDIIMQGRHIRLNEGSYVDLAIENGTQGMNRCDLIVARYTKDSLTGVEDCNLVVIKGTESTGSATVPAYNSGDIINDHVLIADMPLYAVNLNGLNVQSVTAQFDVYAITMAWENIANKPKITDLSGTLGINKGGTGATTVEAARKALGLGETSGAVPIANGGTGATTVAGARNALGLGDTGGAVPVANGGTGSSSASGAVKNLGLTGLMKRKLVWENASPGSDFGATEVTLSAANGLDVVSWDIVYIMVKGNNAAVYTESTEYGASGHRAHFAYHATNTYVCIRQCAQSGLKFSFENGKSNGSDSSSPLIPYQIYANYLNQGE